MSRIKTLETSVAAKAFRAEVGDSRNIRARQSTCPDGHLAYLLHELCKALLVHHNGASPDFTDPDREA